MNQEDLKTAVVEQQESYQDYEVTCSVIKVGYNFMGDFDSDVFSMASKDIPASANV